MICLACGGEFVKRRLSQKFCSTLCYVHAYNILRSKETFRLSSDDLALRNRLEGF